MLALPSLVAAVALMAPLIAAIVLSDLRTLRIPNRMVLVLFGIFLVTGLPLGLAGIDWGLPWDTFLWRIGYALAAFGVGFGLYVLAGGNVGGGDLKLIAAVAPFLSGSSVASYLLLVALIALGGLVLHWIVRKMLRGRQTGWESLDQNVYFPAGLALAVGLFVQLAVTLASRLGAFA